MEQSLREGWDDILLSDTRSDSVAGWKRMVRRLQILRAEGQLDVSVEPRTREPDFVNLHNKKIQPTPSELSFMENTAGCSAGQQLLARHDMHAV
eukprot:3750695-Rhodomonas_salina.1